MADFFGALSSTSFRVKDDVAWLADPDVKQIQEHVKSEEGFFDKAEDGYWSFGWYGQYPGVVLSEWQEEEKDGITEEVEVELDITEVIARHILPGDVCQIASVTMPVCADYDGISGSEKLRYIGGMMFWVSSKGVVSFDAQVSWSEKLRAPEVLGSLASLLTDAKKKLRP